MSCCAVSRLQWVQGAVVSSAVAAAAVGAALGGWLSDAAGGRSASCLGALLIAHLSEFQAGT